MLVSILDLERSNAAVTGALAAAGPDALIWPELRMAAVRPGVRLPPDALAHLQRPPREVNRQRWAIIDGLERLLREARLHSERSALNGNADLAAVARGGASEYPVVDPTTGARSAGPSLPTRLGFMAAINMSLGATAPADFDPDDPVNIATERAARSLPVVMAAGNATEVWRGSDAFSKWAKAPWVISVSALRDGRIAEDSATGEPGGDSFAPTVAAPDDRLTVFHADSGEVEAYRGTSIAAAVVSRQLARLAIVLLSIRFALEQQGRGEREGIPRVGVGSVDAGFNVEEIDLPTWPYGALPLVGVDTTAVRAIAAASAQTGLSLDGLPSPGALRRLLIASARDVEGHERHQVGAGEVSDGSTAVFLAGLTAGAYVRHLGGDTPVTERTAVLAGDLPLCDDALPNALELWDRSLFAWLWDYRRADQLLGLTFQEPLTEGEDDGQTPAA